MDGYLINLFFFIQSNFTPYYSRKRRNEKSSSSHFMFKFILNDLRKIGYKKKVHYVFLCQDVIFNPLFSFLLLFVEHDLLSNFVQNFSNSSPKSTSNKLDDEHEILSRGFLTTMVYERIEGVIYHLIHFVLFHGSQSSSSSNNNNDNISSILQTHLDSFQPNTPKDKSGGSKEEEEEEEDEEEEIKMKRRVVREKFLFFHLKLHIQQFIQSHLISPLMTSNKLKEEQIAAAQEAKKEEDREEEDSQTTNSEDEEENSDSESDF